MPTPFKALRERLLVAGIAPRHVRRYIAELEDHLADLRREAESDTGALARLGTLDDLARPMLAKPELRSLAARYPRTVLGVGPMALWLGLTIGTGGLIYLSSHVLSWKNVLPPPGPGAGWVYGLVYAVMLIYLRILPTALAVLAVIAAIRQRSSLLVPAVGAALVLIMSCTSTFELTPSHIPGQQGELQITWWLLPFLVPFTDAVGPMNGPALVPGLIQAAGMLAAIMAASLLWRRHQHQ